MNKPLFLYHGSSKLVDCLFPFQAYDWVFKEGNQLAVYATSEMNIALAFALGAVLDNEGKCERVMDPKYGLPIQMIFFSGHPNYGERGYLYKVRSDGFTYAGGTQWVNPNPVSPIEVKTIQVDDYLHLCRYATNEEKEELKREN
ncbi:hypothetical protein [Paenibacillus daejeonensis]|uniref:hypothetical protein n=1 Tax=Paenibacillus daejeonensis TaxID=135193 RepID=UPI00036F57FA|nr:hypothetical protein [Paenibacillus daejeonensis]